MNHCLRRLRSRVWRPPTVLDRLGRRRQSSIATAEVESARAYCLELLRKYDSPSYTLKAFIPPGAQTAYLAIWAFNLEIARVADTVSTPHVGAMRMQFWRDNVAQALDGTPPKHPVPTLLAAANEELAERTTGNSGNASLSKSWFMKVISAREKYLGNNPYVDVDALERYAESTYSTLLYLCLQALPLNSLAADHVASHVGKAAGIVAVLRGLPLLAFPALAGAAGGGARHHSNDAGLGSAVQQQRARFRQGSVVLPLDAMADAGLREEDVFRHGSGASGLKDAVFRVATRANDHLITARSMLSNLRRGEDVGHSFEHADEEDRLYPQRSELAPAGQQWGEVRGAFGVLMPGVSTRLWLERLEKVDFDIFRPELRARDWKLPFKAYVAYNRKAL